MHPYEAIIEAMEFDEVLRLSIKVTLGETYSVEKGLHYDKRRRSFNPHLCSDDTIRLIYVVSTNVVMTMDEIKFTIGNIGDFIIPYTICAGRPYLSTEDKMMVIKLAAAYCLANGLYD